LAAGGAADDAAVVVAAINETHASNRFTAILYYVVRYGDSCRHTLGAAFVTTRPRSVAVLQLRAHERAEFDERWTTILGRVRAAADDRAELIVLPEGTVPAYVIGNERVDPSVLERAARDVIAVAAASGATIVYGGGRYDGERFANSAYVVTRDGIVGSVDKCFLWHFDRRWFSAGDALDPVDSPVGRLGVFVCADGRIPTIASTLVARGAELLVVPTAWVTSGRDPAALENLQADVMAVVRAHENGVPLVAANKCGIEARSVAYCGKSLIVAADGTIAAQAGQHDETTLRASIAIGAPFLTRSTPATVQRGSTHEPLGETVRIALTPFIDGALHHAAALADADVVIDPHTVPASNETAVVDDEAFLDPRALVPPRLGGVRLFIWHASIHRAWVVPYARTRAAELRAYVVVLDTLDRRAFAVDPDGSVICGTFDTFAVAAFTFDRRRTDAWLLAPHTDVRAGLEAVAAIAARPATA
jgi:predicted amidohydrolase